MFMDAKTYMTLQILCIFHSINGNHNTCLSHSNINNHGYFRVTLNFVLSLYRKSLFKTAM